MKIITRAYKPQVKVSVEEKKETSKKRPVKKAEYKSVSIDEKTKQLIKEIEAEIKNEE